MAKTDNDAPPARIAQRAARAGVLPVRSAPCGDARSASRACS